MTRILLPLFAALTALLPSLAQAGAAECSTRIDDEPVTIIYHADDPTYSSWRERWFSRNRTCPGAVVITYLMPDLTAEERSVFCANYDQRTRSYSQPAHGPRDAFGRCTQPSRTCELVNTSRDTAMTLAGIDSANPSRSMRERLGAGVSALTHSSGAMILTGQGTALLTTLSQAGAVVASPAVLAGAAASVVVIGGAVYLCSD